MKRRRLEVEPGENNLGLRRSAAWGTIAAVIVFINITIIITILISFPRSTLPHPAVIPT